MRKEQIKFMKEFFKKILYYFVTPLSDKNTLKLALPLRTGEKLDLKDPKSFNQKLQWYKLYYRDPLMTKCADKYSVREFIESKGYGHLLTKLYGVYNNASEINFDELPNSFVLKTTNAMGTNIIVKDKSTINKDEIKDELDQWLNRKPLQLWFGREWAYQNIDPVIICEEFIDSNGQGLVDYKFHCFNSEPKVIQVSSDRETDLKVDYFDLDWQPLEVKQKYPNKGDALPEPPKLQEMKEIAKELSSEFPYVRVDLYNINEKIIFGELTFYSSAGFTKYKPKEFNYYLGSLFELPNKKV